MDEGFTKEAEDFLIERAKAKAKAKIELSQVTSHEQLLGKTFGLVQVIQGELLFLFYGCGGYKFYHAQDCCESVHIEDIVGNLEDLMGSPILQADEVTDTSRDDYSGTSVTWTFYKFATIKGYVTVRWLGESNGYYSESVSFTEIEEER